MKLKTFIISAVIGLAAISCAREEAVDKTSPEAITGLFIDALSAGDCDAALNLSTGDANDNVSATKDAGCEGYESEIGISCDTIIDNKTTCTCIERQDGGMASAYKYDLEKVDGEWKITAFDKDMGEMGNMMGDPSAGGMSDMEPMDLLEGETDGDLMPEEVIETVEDADIH